MVTVPEFLRSLALEGRDDAVRTIEHLWKEALALESVSAELGERHPLTSSSEWRSP